jgi:uncharacterized protein YggU (UPF0235/DUF167 family)
MVLAWDGDVLKAAVTAPAEEGRANQAVIDLLAGTWRLPRSAFAVMQGAAHRDKVLSIAGEPGALVGRINEWLKGLAGRDG